MKDQGIARRRELKVGAVIAALFSLLVTLTGLSAVFEPQSALAAGNELGETVEFTPNYDFADIPQGSGSYADKGNIIWGGNGGSDNGVTNKKSNIGFAWCIDLGLRTPADAKNLIWDKSTAQKLTPANIADTTKDTAHGQERYDAAYKMITNMINSWKAGKYDEAKKYNLYAQALLGNPTAQGTAGEVINSNGQASPQAGTYSGVTPGEFTDLTGFKAMAGGPSVFDHAIDFKAPEGSYLTYVPPTLPNGKVAVNQAQRMVPPDQPGIKPEPKNPVIKTKASLDGDQVKAGAKVVDTVSYED
ncbi:MAG: hypothetical protein E7E09_09995, partial [Winkia neuii]|nr:hypothetical protein [Winkia neuii]